VSCGPVRSRELDLMVVMGPFQPEVFHDSMIPQIDATAGTELASTAPRRDSPAPQRCQPAQPKEKKRSFFFFFSPQKWLFSPKKASPCALGLPGPAAGTRPRAGTRGQQGRLSHTGPRHGTAMPPRAHPVPAPTRATSLSVSVHAMGQRPASA